MTHPEPPPPPVDFTPMHEQIIGRLDRIIAMLSDIIASRSPTFHYSTADDMQEWFDYHTDRNATWQ